MVKAGPVKRKLGSAGPPVRAPGPPAGDGTTPDSRPDEDVSEDLSGPNSDAEEAEDEEGSDLEDSDDSDLSDTEEEIAQAVKEYVAGESNSDEDDEKEESDGLEDEHASYSDLEDSDVVEGDGDGSDDEEEDSDAVEADGEGRGDAGNADTRISRVEESDSEDEGELASRNTMGDVPLEWYRDEKHIGYDVEGRKIMKKERKDQLEAFLARANDPKNWRRVYDDYNDEEILLTREEVDMIRRLREGKIPHGDVDPYEPYVDWFEWEDKGHPLSSAPEPKRRFIPSKWEAKKVVKLVRAIRKGWISLEKPKEKPKYYLLWGDDLRIKDTERTANGLAYIPAPKRKLPGHQESYNPPEEYVPTQEEINAYQLMYEEDRPKFLPKKHDSLRQVPAYSEYIKEIFERCLDLYLCPRSRKRRINIDPESLVPKLPQPKDLQPFPTTYFLDYRGHTGAVNSISTSPCGEWLASGSVDGSVRLWEVQTGRCRKIWDLGGAVRRIAWNPNPELSILAIAVENDVIILDTGVGLDETETTVASLLSLANKDLGKENASSPLATWAQHAESKGLKLSHVAVVHSVAWHYKGDYFVTVSPDANTRAVLVHQLSKQQTQNPFRKHHGRVVRVLFHPSRPFLFVATKMQVRVYNLVKQELSKKLITGLDGISSMAVHPGGDNLIVGSKEAKLCWFDMDLSTKPYKIIKNHGRDITAVTYHKTYPLFATCSEDATAHVFHGMVYSGLLENPLIVPVKVLRGNQTAIFDCSFHPKQPWLFTAGSDAVIRLYCN